MRDVIAAARWLYIVAVEIPQRLTSRDQWVLWRGVWRAGKWTKVPYQIADPRKPAAVDDPATWGRFDDAVDAQSCSELRLDGIGYVLTEADNLVGLDLDKCRDPLTGAVESWALAIVRQISSYTELSPSGTGIRIFVHGSLPGERRRKGPIEMYTDGRFLTLTGHRIAGRP